MYELRILSGLHRGATLPLDSTTHIIGASEDADVVMVDPDIEAQHASIALTADGWLLASLDGSVRTADSNQPASEIPLAPGDFARVANIWITVVTDDARWKNPPSEPVDDLFDATAVEDDMSSGPASVNAKADAGAGDTADGTGASLAGNASDEAGATAQTGAASPRGSVSRVAAMLGKRSRVAYAGLFLVSVATAAYAIGFRPPAMRSVAQPEASPIIKHGKPSEATIARAFDATHDDGSKRRRLTPSELRGEFRKRLRDADLIKRFDLRLQEDQWLMKGFLNEEEAARFERILVGFFKSHSITFPVHAIVGSGEAMLPFKIRQVIWGSNASVITQDGDRLFVGDEFRGVRLVAVRGSHLTFDGKRKIEVVW